MPVTDPIVAMDAALLLHVPIPAGVLNVAVVPMHTGGTIIANVANGLTPAVVVDMQPAGEV
jgi:hypothetical protein